MRLFSDFASGTLASDIDSVAGVITLNAGDGTRFPSPVGYPSEWALLTLENAVGQKEHVRLTSRSGDVLNVLRAQEGTAATSFLTGSRCELRTTASAFGQMFQKDEDDEIDCQEGLGNRIYFKRYLISGDAPGVGDLYEGEIAVNIVDNWIWCGAVGAAPGHPLAPVVMSNGPNGALQLMLQPSHGFKVGQPLYFDGSIYRKAISTSLFTCGVVVVKKVISVDRFLASLNGAIEAVTPADIGLGSIVPGQTYYVSDTTAGHYKTTGIGSANFLNPLAVGVTVSALLVVPHAPRQLPTHAALPDLTAPNSHPTSAITGLDTALSSKVGTTGDQTITGAITARSDPSRFFRAGANDNASPSYAYLYTNVPSTGSHYWDMTYNNGSVTNGGFRMSLVGGPSASEVRWELDGNRVFNMHNTLTNLGQLVSGSWRGIEIQKPLGHVTISANRTAHDQIFTVRNAALTVTQAFLANGTVNNYNGVYGTISGERLKSGIVPANSKLAKLNRLQVRNYTLKDDPDKVRMLGFVAEEVEKVMPGIVKTVPVGKDGKKMEKMVATSLLVPMLVKAVQEMSGQIRELERRLDSSLSEDDGK